MSEIRSQATHELVVPIHKHVCAANLEDCTGECYLAAAALQNDGWLKPRTVTSVEELEALPGLSVIRDADLFDSPGDILEKWFRPTGWQWMRVGSLKFRASNEINLPATVIFTPEDAG
ncbi:hypothetical protein [Rhodococcus qingshengii]|uniref:hypothetical protein n=1 Tax=Rhodococcus qingshengii TaxID=334542 RepID=UPI0022B2C02F|nr:hypothetical protein [Rhodococcus qingshengii]MCZ4613323.1 hypothetical protein [Rhodococcus qingshengii]